MKFLSKIFLFLLIYIIIGSFIAWEAYSDYTNSRIDNLSEDSLVSFLNPSNLVIAKDPIMSKMGNETLKQELGRSSWRLLHVYYIILNL